MQQKKPRVAVTRRLPEVIEARMQELFDVQLNVHDVPMTQEALMCAVSEADVLVPTVTDKIDAYIIAAAGPQLKLIANFGAGFEHIDLGSAQAKNIAVTNTPGVLTVDTADIAMALMLAAPRRLSEGAQLVREGKWQGWSPTFMLGRRVTGKKLGIIGMGRIGQAVARRAKGFDMQLHYHRRTRLHESVEQELGVTYWDNLDAMLAEMDILTLHAPLNSRTRYILNAERFKKMKPGMYLVNTARGGLVDEAAMIAALQNGQLAGVGLDVYEEEPQVSAALRKLPNVVLLPHVGSATMEARQGMGEKVLINIQCFMHGHPMPDKVLLAG